MGWLPALALAALMVAPSSAALSVDGLNRTVSVRVHDYVGLGAAEVAEAQRQASAFYATIGVVLDWRQTVRPDEVREGLARWPCDAPASLAVVILSTAMAQHVHAGEDIAGYAAVDGAASGNVAYIVADRTRWIAEGGHVTHARVLAGVMTHELAHLLMPQRGHSASGIMRPVWQPGEFRVLPRQAFSAGEARDIRAGVASLRAAVAPGNN